LSGDAILEPFVWGIEK